MAHEIQLKYGCNPNQKPSRIYLEGGELPLEVLSGRPGYINFLDALNSWQLVTELKNELLRRGILPFYGTSPSHLASQRLALGAGFVPAWAELVTSRV